MVSFKEYDWESRSQLLLLQCRIASGRALENMSLRGSGGVNVRPASADHAQVMTERYEGFCNSDAPGFVDGGSFTLGRGAICDISQQCRVIPLGKKDRQYLDFATVDIERAVGTTYSLNPISREPSGGSIDRDGEDSADDGEELSRKHHGVGR